MNSAEVKNFPGFREGITTVGLTGEIRTVTDTAGTGCAAALDAERYLAALVDAPEKHLAEPEKTDQAATAAAL